MNRGLPEYECSQDGTLYLTLLRSLSMAVRQWWRWVKADDSAMRGVSVYEYAVGIAPDDAAAAGLSEDYARPLAAFAMPPGVQAGESRGGLVELSGGGIRLSTVERSPHLEGAIEVRLYNPTARSRKATLKLGFRLRRAEAVRLDGRRLRKLAVKGRSQVALRLGAGEIATVRLHPAK